MAPLFPKPERRKNRVAEPDKYVMAYAKLHNEFVEMANITQSQMNDAQFRVYVQDKAHKAITEAGRVK